MNSTAKITINQGTPGVYVSSIDAFETSIDAFETSIVGVDTAVPVFIGYTQYAGDPASGAPLYGVPVAISSMADYGRSFGGAAKLRFEVSVLPPRSATSDDAAASPTPDFIALSTPNAGSLGASDEPAMVLQAFALTLAPPLQPFSLYRQIQLFFANGGGRCYVVSVGSYGSNQRPTAAADSRVCGPGAITAADLVDGITAAGKIAGPTMTVVPEACQLEPDEYGTVIQAMMVQASTLRDRVAILDLPGCLSANTIERLRQCQTDLWRATDPAIAGAGYAAAYGPALKTTIVPSGEITFAAFAAEEPARNALANNILTAEAYKLYRRKPQLPSIQSAIAAAFPLTSDNRGTNDAVYSGNGSGYPGIAGDQTPAQWQARLDALLQQTLPLFERIKQAIVDRVNVMAPSGAMAGIWAQNDRQWDAWHAPANIALASVTAPLYDMNDAVQPIFNLPTNGQAINIIRTMPSRDTVARGARTLDGNSKDNRYIHVRRTLIYIEQSIRATLRNHAFGVNDAITWAAVTASVSRFLHCLWQQGGLVGVRPSDALTVSCGPISPMTGQNGGDGEMLVRVAVCLILPDNFIELTVVHAIGR